MLDKEVCDNDYKRLLVICGCLCDVDSCGDYLFFFYVAFFMWILRYICVFSKI